MSFTNAVRFKIMFYSLLPLKGASRQLLATPRGGLGTSLQPPASGNQTGKDKDTANAIY